MTLPLFPYQERGAEFLLRHSRCGLHDEMGIGKTATTIRAIDQIVESEGEVHGIVICPAMLRQNWINEFKKFSRTKPRLVKGQTIHDYVAWSRRQFDILVTSYEMATKWRAEFTKQITFLDFVVLDEAHLVKNYKAGRTRSVFGYNCNLEKCWTQFSCRVFHVTGTPMSNDPFDIYPFMRLVRETELTPASFAGTYFVKIKTPWGVKLELQPGAADYLRQSINKHRLARTMTDVGVDLPPIVVSETLVDGDTQPILDLFRAEPELEEAIALAVEQGGLSHLESHHIMALRRLVGAAKAVPYGRMLAEELVYSDDKRVVFCCHTTPALEVQKILSRAGIESVVVNGGTTEEDRQIAVRRFQDPADPLRVFIGNMKVAGTGLTLTAASHVDLLESDWTPAGNAQAIKRLHRHGQHATNVWARFITLDGSIDVRVNAAVRNKTQHIALVDGRDMLPKREKA